MDEAGISGDFSGLMVGMIGMFVLTMIIIVFVLVYQRKLLRQKRQQEETEADYQLALLEANVKNQEIERQRIARDLHDGVGVMLSTTQLYFDQLCADEPAENEDTRKKINELLEDTIQSVRHISADLRPVVLDNLGLSEALAELTEKVGKAARLEFEFSSEYHHKLTKDQELLVYRVVQELLTNTIRHAQASAVSVELESDPGHFRLDYRDNGVGFHRNQSVNAGLGMKNIESRIKILGGKLTVHDTNEAGVFISITVLKGADL
ncbi:MAG: sensor histidine kinase [Roseivirga sp.]|nr:sensor histidine kinase [Roseivirga sp.]